MRNIPGGGIPTTRLCPAPNSIRSLLSLFSHPRTNHGGLSFLDAHRGAGFNLGLEMRTFADSASQFLKTKRGRIMIFDTPISVERGMRKGRLFISIPPKK